ncbi:hypothetical protein CRUP_014469 [Coryphaenoides rupestris]|nr:hypothetical protein CRUP_014469 [Coryphaenoides rupestris]
MLPSATPPAPPHRIARDPPVLTAQWWICFRKSCVRGVAAAAVVVVVVVAAVLVVVVLAVLVAVVCGGGGRGEVGGWWKIPFIIFWGVPDTACPSRPDLASLGVEPEGRVAVFYEDSLGSYPYFRNGDTPVNGGLPQHTRLNRHLQQTAEDLAAALPAARYLGLGVLRWAQWTPQWARDQEKQALYLEASRALLKGFFPDWSPVEVEKWAQVDFEAAGRSILTETLREVRRLRPKALWGISPYPTCYTLAPGQTPPTNNTAGCPAPERELNDQLQWLWKRSSALYPFLSLEKLQADLLHSVGESAALGAAGVVIWERDDTKTERECADLARFVRQVLGRYSVNVTTATRLCSSALCQGRGRCIRQNPGSSAYLHMPPIAEKVEEEEEEEEEGRR